MLVAVAVYAPSLGYGFVYDDAAEVLASPFVRAPERVWEAFAHRIWLGTDVDAPMYRPLTTASFALTAAVAGLDPAAFHLGNVLLHAVVCLLLFALGLRLGLPSRAAGLAALWFAVHPVHVEAVANVAGRKDLLMTAFVLAAVLLHLAARGGGFGLRAASAGAFGLALLSKESGVVALAFVVLLEGSRPRGELPPGQRRVGPLLQSAGWWAVVAVAYGLGRAHVIGDLALPHIPFMENPAAHAPPLERMLTALAVLGQGALLLLVPWRLSADYGAQAIALATSAADPRVLATVLVVFATATWAALRRDTWVALALLAYLAAVLPTSNLLLPIGTLFGERLLYLPSAVFALAVGGLFARAERWAPRPARATASCVVVALAVVAVVSERRWRDDLTLFTATVATVPSSAKAQHLLGNVLVRAGRPEEALAHFARALALLPERVEVRARVLRSVAVASTRLGRYADARAALAPVLAAAPDDVATLRELAEVALAEGEVDEAAGHWTQVLALAPNDAATLGNLATWNFQRGAQSLALEQWKQATRLDPTLRSAWLNLAAGLAASGDVAEARRVLEALAARSSEGERAEVVRRLEQLEGP